MNGHIVTLFDDLVERHSSFFCSHTVVTESKGTPSAGAQMYRQLKFFANIVIYFEGPQLPWNTNRKS